MRGAGFLVAVALWAMGAVAMAGAAFGADGWAVTAQNLPPKLVWDASAAASVDAGNTGDTTWDSGYGLASVEGITATAMAVDRWGLTAAPVVGTVAAGASYTWDFGVIAPPISTLRYVTPVSPTADGVVVGLDCNWLLAHPYAPSATFVTTDIAEQATVINRFRDILPGTTGEWAAFHVEELAGRAPMVVQGYPDASYRPRVVVTRDQMAVYMSRALDLATGPYEGAFRDVLADHWAWPWIEALVREGVVEGYPDGTYRPGWSVNRGQMAVYVARGIWGGLDVPTGPPEGRFWDVADYTPGPPHWAYDEIEFAVAHHVVQGYPEGNYRPGNNVTRDQMAVFVWRGFVMPTGTPVVLAGPATCAFDPAETEYVGWTTTEVNPEYAYVAFDALRLDTNLLTPSGTWLVYLEVWEHDVTSGEDVAVRETALVEVTEGEMLAAKEAAADSGVPYLVVSAPIPELPDGYYRLVTRVGTGSPGAVSEVSRKPVFWVGTPLPPMVPDEWGQEAAQEYLTEWAMTNTEPYSGSMADMAESDDVYCISRRVQVPPDYLCWPRASNHGYVWHDVPIARRMTITVEYRIVVGNVNCCSVWGDPLDGATVVPYGWGVRVMSGPDPWMEQWFEEGGSGSVTSPAANDLQGGDGTGFLGHPSTDATYTWTTSRPWDFITDGDVLVVFCGGSYEYLYVDRLVLTVLP